MRLPPQLQPVTRGGPRAEKFLQQNALVPAHLSDLRPSQGEVSSCLEQCAQIADARERSACEAACQGA